MSLVPGRHAQETCGWTREMDVSIDQIRIASFPPAIKQNPYQRLFYEGLARFGFELEAGNRLRVGWLIRRRGVVRILHFHWIQGYYEYSVPRSSLAGAALSWLRLGLFGARLLTARSLGYRVVWTVHQVQPHESKGARLDRAGARVMRSATSVFLAHDELTARRVESMLHVPRKRIAVVPHGSFIGVYPKGRRRREVRKELGIAEDAFVFLSFGHLRGYKAIHLLLDAFKATNESLPTARLVIAGMPLDQECVADVRKAAASDDRVVLLLKFIPDERVAELFGAADFAILTRSDGGTSGALVLALSLGVPVLAADIESYRSVTGENGSARFFRPSDSRSLASELRAAVSEGPIVAGERARVALTRAESLSWNDTCRTAAALFREACK